MVDRRTDLPYEIAAARSDDVPHVARIELAAARLLAGHVPPSELNETTSEDDLNDAQRRGHLWVARLHQIPVGFAHMRVLEPAVALLDEIDVHPEHGRRGLGAKLVLAVCACALRSGCRWITLVTFKDLPWNMPFYARLGFAPIPRDELPAAVVARMDDEARRGLDPGRRVAMRRACAA
jgi:GNAT superfamily N-acetyltransferase